ncbi:MDR family MFS transporter [Tessaracoccus terricola]
MPETRADNRLDPRTRGVIAILLVSAFIVILNETTLNIAIKAVMDDMGVTERTAQWLTTAFMLTMAVIIPVSGWLLERFSTKRVFLLAMTLFIIGTFIVAIGPLFGIVLAGRVVQASGTAVMMPLLMTTVLEVVPEERRGVMMGNISMVIAVAPALGPTLSGLVLQVADWRTTFWIILPLAIALLALGAAKLETLNEPRRVPVDGPSVGLSVIGFGGLVYSLSLFGEPSVPVLQLVIVLVVGLAALVLFLMRQVRLARTGKALLNLGTFATAGFRNAVVVVAIAMAAMFGTLIMLPLILQDALGMEPLHVGLMMLPGGLVMGLLGPTVGKLYDKVGPRPLVVPATALIGVVLALFSLITVGTPVWFIVVCHVAMSIGFAFMFTPLLTSALGSLPRPLYPHGSAAVGTVQQLAGAIGTALFVTIYSSQARVAEVTGLDSAHAMLTGSRVAFLCAAAVCVLAFVGTWWLRKPERSGDQAEEPSAAAMH